MTTTEQDSHALARRALEHFQARTTDQAPAIMRQSLSAYRDPDVTRARSTVYSGISPSRSA